MALCFHLRQCVRIFLLVAIVGGLSLSTLAEANAYARHHKKARHTSAPVNRQVPYADLVIDGDTGMVLHASNAESVRHPASLTKMMTLYIAFQALEAGKLHLDQRLWVSVNASEQSPTKLGLRPGQTIRTEDAVLGLVTESANDAAVVLAEAIGGSEERFAQYMTRQAHALGMSRTHFENPSGLPDPDQVTSAADMVRLGYALIHHYPQYYRFFSRETFVYAGTAHHNHNHLMERYDGMDGIKTGYIRTSGFNLVASAVRKQTRLIGAVFGGHSAPGRDKQMEDLLDDAFAAAAPGQLGRPPVVRVGQKSEDDDDGALTAGEYLSLPMKAPVLFSPINRAAVAGAEAVSQREAQALPPNAPPVAPGVVPTPANSPSNPGIPPVESQSPAPVVPTAPPAAPPAAVSASQPLVTPPPAQATAEAPVSPSREAVAPAQEKPAPKAAVAKAAVREVPRTWAIQIGAYADIASGKRALTGLMTALPALKASQPVIQQVRVNSSTLFRARFTKLDEQTARSSCATLTRERKNCLVVSPQS